MNITLLFTVMVFHGVLLVYPLFKEESLKILSSLILLGSLIMFNSNNLLVLYLSFELSLIPMVLIILGWGYNQERILASSLLLLYTVVASVPFILFLLSDSLLGSVGGMVLFLPFLVKLPLVGVHLWLPKAHVESPTLGSLLLAGLLLKLGSYGIYKMMEGFSTLPNLTSYLLLGSGLIFFLTSTQSDGKSMIAYSSVGHMNLGVALLLTLYPLSESGYILMNYLHMIISGMMFYLIGLLFYYGGSRMIYFLKSWSSVILIVLGILILGGNSGTPPMSSFLSELVHLSYLFLSSPLYLLPLWGYGFLGGYFSIYFFSSFIFSPTIKKSSSFSISSWFLLSFILYTLIYFFLML